MTVRPDNPDGEDSSPDRQRLRSPNTIIQGVVDLASDERANVVGDQEHQLRGLIQTLLNRKGRFALIFAVCQDLPLRGKLTSRIRAGLVDQRIHEVYLKPEEGLLDRLLKVPGAPEPLFAYGIEHLIPPADKHPLTSKADRLLREETVQELQVRREYFRQLKRPLVLWMPEYAYEIIGKQAHDFWSWGSHSAFFFTERQSKKTELSDLSAETGDTNIVTRGGGDVITKGGIDGIGRSVAIAGDVSGSTIVTGDRNIFVGFQQAAAARSRTEQHSILSNRLHAIPQPPGDFIGREEELQELLGAIEREDVTSLSLHGQAGIGKSALAFELVERLALRYSEAQFYLDLDCKDPQSLSVADALAHVIHAYHPATKLPDSESDLRALYQSVLYGQRAIILIDNAASSEEVETLTPPSSCVLLVTSHQPLVLPGLLAKRIDTLPQEDARNLLLNLAPQIGDFADEIACLCGYLPLALRLAAGALTSFPTIKPPMYAARLKSTPKRFDFARASLELTYRLLSEEMKELWRKLTVFSDSFDEVAASAVWRQELNAAQDKLRELFVYNLLEWNEVTRRYHQHDLTRAFANSKLSASELADVQRIHAAHYLAVLNYADDLYLKGGDALTQGLALFDLERRNIRAGQAWACAEASTDKFAAALCLAYSDAGVHVLSLRQHALERVNWLEASLSVARRLKLTQSEGNVLANLGNAYADLGETRRAIQYLEQALLISRKIGDRQRESNALGSLGLAYASLGETKLAIQFYEQYLMIAREIGDRRSEGNALGSLGNAYAALGETKQAIQFYEQRLVIAREIGDRRGEGADLGNLGTSYAALGETRRAIQFYEQAIVLNREIGDRIGEAAGLGNLGSAYAGMGETRRAIQLYEQQLMSVREIGDGIGEVNALTNLGVAYADLGETHTAIEYYEQALSVAWKFGYRRGAGYALSNLGFAHADLGDTRRAIEYFEQSLAIRQEIGDRRGESHDLWGLSLVADRLGDRARAIALSKQSLKIREEIEDPNADKVRKQLAEWHKETSRNSS